MPELDPEQNEQIREGAEYAVVDMDGNAVTPWVSPDEDGTVQFDFSSDVREYELAMKLPNGTVIVGEHTVVEVEDEK
jgi:hypothetical protein